MAPQSPSALPDVFIPGKIMQNPPCYWAEFEMICHHLLTPPFSCPSELSPWEQQLDGEGRLRDEVRLDWSILQGRFTLQYSLPSVFETLSSAMAELFYFGQVCLRTKGFMVMGTHFSAPVLTPDVGRGLGGGAPLLSRSWKLGKGSFVDMKII